MVQPVFRTPELLEDGLERVEARTDGLVQRGRLRAYDELTGLATCTIYLRRGATATLDGIQTLGDDEDILSYVNYDVLILAPSGRVHDGGYVLGLANGIGFCTTA